MPRRTKEDDTAMGVMKKKWLALALIIVALLASLQSMPRSLVVELSVPGTAAYISNTGPFGTSKLANALSARGYTVKPIPGISALNQINIEGYTDVIYVVIAPQNLTIKYAEEISNTLTSIAERYGVRIHIVLFDELGGAGDNILLRKMGLFICPGQPSFRIKPTVPQNEYATILYSDGVVLPTGYTSLIERYNIVNGHLNILPPTIWSSKPALPYNVGGEEILAAVMPGPEKGQIAWVPLAGACNSIRGSVLAMADSTPAVNMAIDNNTEYLLEDIKMITYGLGRYNKTLILFDGALYTDISKNIAVRLHPSFLLLSLSSIYDKIEARGLKLVETLGLTGILVVLAGSIVMVATWGGSSFSSRKGLKEKVESPHVSLARVIKGTVTIFGSHNRLERICTTSKRLLSTHSVRELAYSTGDSELRRLLLEYLDEIESSCTSTSFLAFLPVWGGRARRVEELTRRILSYLKIKPVGGEDEG